MFLPCDKSIDILFNAIILYILSRYDNSIYTFTIPSEKSKSKIRISDKDESEYNAE